MTDQQDNRLKTASNLLVEEGVINSIEGEFAFVQTQQQSACGGCASSSSCGTSVLASYFKSGDRNLIKVKNIAKGRVGDSVMLSLDESKLLKHSFMAYGVPLLGLFIFAVGFKWLGQSVFDISADYLDLISVVGGFTGVGLGWFFTHKTYQPVLPEMRLLSSGKG